MRGYPILPKITDNCELRGDCGTPPPHDIAFAFQFPEMIATFQPIDHAANAARSLSRLLGVLSIGLVLFALLLASADLLEIHLIPYTDRNPGLYAGGFGMIGAAIGLWGLFKSSPNHRWLRMRFRTERIRQFHFQYIAQNFRTIAAAAGNETAVSAYKSDRFACFSAFKSTVLKNARSELEQVLSAPESRSLSPLIAPKADPPTAPDEKLANVLTVWKELRLQRELDYANNKLESSWALWRLRPHHQRRLFSFVNWTLIGAIVALQGVHLIEPLSDDFHFPHLSAGPLNLATIWAALLALAVRALEDGLRPHREIERYAQYRSRIRAAMEQFEEAQTADEKIRIANEFENASSEEMRIFLKAFSGSLFVL